MTRGSRGLIAFYLATTVWLAYTTVTTWGHTPAWVTCLNAAASVIGLLALVRELDLRDARRQAADLEARARREREQRNGRPLNQLEAAAWFGLIGRLDPDPDDDQDDDGPWCRTPEQS